MRASTMALSALAASYMTIESAIASPGGGVGDGGGRSDQYRRRVSTSRMNNDYHRRYRATSNRVTNRGMDGGIPHQSSNGRRSSGRGSSVVAIGDDGCEFEYNGRDDVASMAYGDMLASSSPSSSSSSSSSSISSAIKARGGGDDDDAEYGNDERRLHYHSPRARATLAMATCMSLHYLAYSLARPATMTLFTSSRLGFGGGGGTSTAYPLAMTFISPVSFLLLLWYGVVLERYGPGEALTRTSLWCAAGLTGSGLLIGKLDDRITPSSSSTASTTITKFAKYVVGLLFVFRESYVQLLTSQHWSFVSSVLTPGESSTWYGPISGLTSITSALGAMGVGKLSGLIGLTGVLMVSGLALASSVWFGGMAYRIAEENGFNPTDEHNSNRRNDGRGVVRQSPAGAKSDIGNSSSSSSSSSSSYSVAERSLLAKARDVFARVPTLWALFCEILACQCLSTLLNVCFVSRVSESIPDDAMRAGYVGRFYAGINVLSSALQFGVLPLTSKYAEPCMLWRAMPLIVLGMTSLLSFPWLGGAISGGSAEHPSLNMIAIAFLLMKTMEFSVRRMLDEMVYVPLDYESRYLGKEVIGVLGYRFGKSGASLALSAITSSFGSGRAMGVRELSYFATGAASLWFVAAWRLSNLVPTKDEAEEAYREMKKIKK
ncbi:hypothetical protein ACHAXA_003810 [Cyclostephanos tholiformis]|uniref:ADP,ATP carrier protein n=1 Tax=Cyclostephanos tholiformis TaxID=382380 RepID=A0ABD3RWG2_9STRA